MKRIVPFVLAISMFTLSSSAFALEAGAKMPEIGLRTLDGKKVTVEALKGKVVVVDFWATWCGPCKEEMPILQKLYAKYGKQGLVILGVSVDREADNIKSFLGKLGVSFPVVHDGEHAVTDRYKPEKMPSSYIVDREGVVKYVHAGFNASDAATFEKEIKELL